MNISEITPRTLQKQGTQVIGLFGNVKGKVGEVVGVTENCYRKLSVDFGGGWVYKLPIESVKLL